MSDRYSNRGSKDKSDFVQATGRNNEERDKTQPDFYLRSRFEKDERKGRGKKVCLLLEVEARQARLRLPGGTLHTGEKANKHVGIQYVQLVGDTFVSVGGRTRLQSSQKHIIALFISKQC